MLLYDGTAWLPPEHPGPSIGFESAVQPVKSPVSKSPFTKIVTHDPATQLLPVAQALLHMPQWVASVLVLMLQPLALRVPSLQVGTLLRQHSDSSKSTQIPKHTNWHDRHCMRHCIFHRCMMVWERYCCCKPCHIRHSCWHWCWC